MKLADILVLLFTHDKGVTLARIEKAKGLALRSGIAWETVQASMTADERKLVDDATAEV